MTVIKVHTEYDKKEKEIKVQYLDTPVKSESDKKQYRVIKLDNGLTAVLISDVSEKKDETSQAEKRVTESDDAYGSGKEETNDDDSEVESSKGETGCVKDALGSSEDETSDADSKDKSLGRESGVVEDAFRSSEEETPDDDSKCKSSGGQTVFVEGDNKNGKEIDLDDDSKCKSSGGQTGFAEDDNKNGKETDLDDDSEGKSSGETDVDDSESKTLGETDVDVSEGKSTEETGVLDDAYESGKEETPDDNSGGKHSGEETSVEECKEEKEVSNGMSAKKEEKMAACALCIDVGNFSDPFEIQGLAHLLEHMVFMGSEKYPDETDFGAFVSKCGGYKNAWTGHEKTQFYFKIQENHLHSAMDRFAQFFISPLIKKDAIKREREAVESEFKMSLQSDFWRRYQLFSSLAGTNHPATKFLFGNSTTLHDNIDEDKLYSELHAFRKRHYSAHRMTLAVQANLPLDTLEDFVKDCFSDVPVNHLPADDFSTFAGKNSFGNPDFKKVYKIKPTEDICQVQLTWTMPPLVDPYTSKPHSCVLLILGQRGKGSLISYLRKKMWCLNSSATYTHLSTCTFLRLTLTLTDEGHDHLKEILEAVFSYINVLRREGPQKRFFDEIQQIQDNYFRFKNENDPVYNVQNMSYVMQYFSPKNYITDSYLFLEYNPEYIKDCIDALSPDNVNIILFNKKFNEEEFDQVEPWFQTKYSSNDIPEEWVTTWKKIEPLSEFHMPDSNMFITDDFSLFELPTEVPDYPVKIYDNNKAEIWYRPDPIFRLPKCYIYLRLVIPAAIESPTSFGIFVDLLKHMIVEDLYDATIAGLYYQLVSHKKGITVTVSGYNQKLPLLLNTILKYIANCYKLVSNDLYDVMKKQQKKSDYNIFSKPAELAREIKSSILTSTEKKTALVHATFDEFINFAKHLTDRMYIRCLVQGNITQDTALESIVKSIEHLNYEVFPWADFPSTKVHQILHGQKCCRVKNFNPADENSVVSNYYQVGLESIKQAVILDVIMLIMKEPLFDQLRTKEQLGYHVYCAFNSTYGVYGYSINVCTQANKYSTEHVDKRIEKFIHDFKNTLKEMTDDDFNFYKESLIKSKECIDLHLSNEVHRNWNEIVSGSYVFDRHHQEISAIKQLSLDDIYQWMSDHSVEGKNFRKLTIQVVGTTKDLDAKIDQDKENDGESNSKEKKDTLTFLTNESDEESKPEDYFITDIKDYKSKLPVY